MLGALLGPLLGPLLQGLLCLVCCWVCHAGSVAGSIAGSVARSITGSNSGSIAGTVTGSVAGPNINDTLLTTTELTHGMHYLSINLVKRALLDKICIFGCFQWLSILTFIRNLSHGKSHLEYVPVIFQTQSVNNVQTKCSSDQSMVLRYSSKTLNAAACFYSRAHLISKSCTLYLRVCSIKPRTATDMDGTLPD